MRIDVYMYACMYVCIYVCMYDEWMDGCSMYQHHVIHLTLKLYYNHELSQGHS